MSHSLNKNEFAATLSAARYRLLILLCVFFISSPAYTQVDTLFNRYKTYLYDSINTSNVAMLISSYNEAKQWPDIDYADQQPARWKVPQHLERVRELAVAWSKPGSACYGNKKLGQVIHAALGHWLVKRYQSSNWWHNHIGVPQYMRDIIILLKDKLTAEELAAALQVLAQNQAYKNSTGANLTWSADLAFHYGALTGNDTLMNDCINRIVREIRITGGDGIQSDQSFHQHGPRLQMYQYGRAFLLDNIRLAWELRGTPWAYPPEKIKILVQFVLEGWQWMARGINTVPGTMDRSVSRAGALRSADIMTLVPYLVALDPEHERDFLAIAERQMGKGIPLQGFRHFPRSDLSVYHTKEFSFFLKTISDRTLATESINHENLKGKLLNSGDSYLIRNGDEYYDLMPAWDWKLLPGLTGFTNADSVIRRPFAGSVSNGHSGLIAMDYQLKGTQGQSLSTHKSWACHAGVVLCLVADIRMKNEGLSYTVLNQCRWLGDVWSDGKRFLQNGKYTVPRASWLFHAGFAYILLKPSTLMLSLDTAGGSWQSINASGSPAEVAEKVFTLAIAHGNSSSAPPFGYVITSCATPKQAKEMARHPSWNVLRNDNDCQAVQFNDGAIQAAFYTPGSFLTKNGKEIVADKPCLIQLSGGKLYLSDPSQQHTLVNVRINGQQWNIQLPAGGSSTEGISIK